MSFQAKIKNFEKLASANQGLTLFHHLKTLLIRSEAIPASIIFWYYVMKGEVQFFYFSNFPNDQCNIKLCVGNESKNSKHREVFAVLVSDSTLQLASKKLTRVLVPYQMRITTTIWRLYTPLSFSVYIFMWSQIFSYS